MILKGQVSSIEANRVRVTFKNREDSVSAPICVATHIGELKINDNVVVVFFSDNMFDGIIIARW